MEFSGNGGDEYVEVTSGQSGTGEETRTHLSYHLLSGVSFCGVMEINND